MERGRTDEDGDEDDDDGSRWTGDGGRSSRGEMNGDPKGPSARYRYIAGY